MPVISVLPTGRYFTRDGTVAPQPISSFPRSSSLSESRPSFPQLQDSRAAYPNSSFFCKLSGAPSLVLLGILVNSFPLFNLHTMRFFGIFCAFPFAISSLQPGISFSQGWRDKTCNLHRNPDRLLAAAPASYLYRATVFPRKTSLLWTPGVTFAYWIDRSMFSAPHLSDGTHDITGFGSTLPSIATTLMGVLTAQWLRTSHSFAKKVGNIALAGVAAVLLGGLWNFTFPINKASVDQLLRSFCRRHQPAIAGALHVGRR